MTRDEAIKAYREARDEADLILVGYILEHPDEKPWSLCKEADSDNVDALYKRVSRRLEKARSNGEKVLTDHPARSPARRKSDAARFFKYAEPGDVADLLSNPEVAKTIVSDDNANKAISHARQDYDTERRAVGEAKDPERRTARQYSEFRDLVYSLVQARNRWFDAAENAAQWEWDDEKREELIDAIEGVRGALDSLEVSPDFDKAVQEMMR